MIKAAVSVAAVLANLLSVLELQIPPSSNEHANTRSCSLHTHEQTGLFMEFSALIGYRVQGY